MTPSKKKKKKTKKKKDNNNYKEKKNNSSNDSGTQCRETSCILRENQIRVSQLTKNKKQKKALYY